ncbi:hypothetical protein DFA_12271 [Cavenderia fasciculata]|uniref:SHSP domain-containing protein n=1 Tax=Cavenderia fasciculata TaxID=261658 RepID=F4QCX2_CACFS|nr:uncharacterized protein DFA_12271 [Cavenderia fasciculata]EGG14496.1 hypothetical protein DFA_12271 [Cavenderia fasciculata]|eukprot:XP_004353905.1 hypothetical protein DFA_12271 [Cavenderia fasciculata]
MGLIGFLPQFSPSYDVLSGDTSFIVSMELPGSPSELDVQVGMIDRRTLVIRGTKEDYKRPNDSYVKVPQTSVGHSPIRYGHFNQVITFDSDISTELVNASRCDGHFIVILPKRFLPIPPL